MKKLFCIGIIVYSVFLLAPISMALGEEDMGKSLEQQRQELKEKERQLKTEEERIKTIEKEVDSKIQKLNQILSQIETALKNLAEVRSEKIELLVKAFEAMPPEEAAIRLSTLEKNLTVQILFKMKSKKAGLIMALMEPKKVAEISESFSRIEKKIPTK